MFDYVKFENDVVQQMTSVFNRWIEENDDLYIFSLDCTREMDSVAVIANTITNLEEQAKEDSEDYWYYKYCEEEWDLFELDTFEAVSADMSKYIDDNNSIFTNPETYEYTELFNKHCDKIIEHCKNALIRFRQLINKDHSNVLLTFHIREYLDSDEKVEIFRSANNENASREYSEHMEEFV